MTRHLIAMAAFVIMSLQASAGLPCWPFGPSYGINNTEFPEFPVNGQVLQVRAFVLSQLDACWGIAGGTVTLTMPNGQQFTNGVGAVPIGSVFNLPYHPYAVSLADLDANCILTFDIQHNGGVFTNGQPFIHAGATSGFPAPCATDATGDGNIDVDDLLFVINHWSNPYNVNHLLAVLNAWTWDIDCPRASSPD